jgi:hypothetical protein
VVKHKNGGKKINYTVGGQKVMRKNLKKADVQNSQIGMPLLTSKRKF